MLRLIIALLIFSVGFGTGIWYDRQQMQIECANGEGEWRVTICLNSELAQ
ncbi:hypothetical protein [uncultured Sulfitobacter sp.]|nr:hypothetical protein [uncultured Sulfitobacter sp.]